MPRWKPLPEELDPQVREFTGQLRRLVDRGGLSIAAVADRTGYSRTSWERYLNGRLLAPRGAVVALAEVTGTQQNHLTTMWELAERAWSRSEMRHDMTMEAIRISQARAALGEAGVAAGSTGSARRAAPGAGVPTAAGPGGQTRAVRWPVSVPVQRGTLPRIPRQPGAGDAAGAPAPSAGGPYADDGPRDAGPSTGDRSDAVPADAVPAAAAAPGAASSAGVPPAAVASGTAPSAAAPSGGGKGRGGRRRPAALVAGAVGALLLTAAAVLFIGRGGDPGGESGGDGGVAAGPSTGPATTRARLPAGVQCSGAACTGQDPEVMGCGGRFADTVARARVGAGLVEVRYSETCGAAWARLTRAAAGDTVTITAGPAKETEAVDSDAAADAYTPMVAVRKPSEAKACVTPASGTTGCTAPE
ncbi:XRE family transcriptional regulator [Streptomyces sp. NBC_00178]|uniref:helix-turn-helix domain-containing protein n=1 Tax=Streptomyces sp. NBC_00178 TaxID=2975672 RepID=UPI002E2E17C2|nr:DUF2690 domain-containing protein [Streptomyces sp. NBC_00178]